MRHTETINMEGCARCDSPHKDLVFTAFNFPPEFEGMPPFTHWALCPTTGEPILARVAVRSDFADGLTKLGTKKL